MSNEANEKQKAADPEMTKLTEGELQNVQGALLLPAVQKAKLYGNQHPKNLAMRATFNR